MSLTDGQRATILDEIIAATERPQRQSYQFTRREYQEHTELTQSQARTVLDNAVKVGQLKAERVLLDGKWADVFWRVEDEPKATRD